MADILRIEGVNKKLASALLYAAHGFSVFPVHYPIGSNCSCGNKGSCADDVKKRAKHPMAHLVPKGKTNATMDAEVIRRWWRIEPNANIGAVPSAFSCTILDVDGDSGQKTFLDLSEKHGEPIGFTVKTSRGFHVYCKYRLDAPNTTNVWEGIDVRNHNGYVLGAASQHISGAFYEIEAGPGNSVGAQTIVLGSCTWPIAAQAQNQRHNTGERIIREGERNVELTSIAGALRNLSFSVDMIYKTLKMCDAQWCDSALKDTELMTIAGSIGKKEIHSSLTHTTKVKVLEGGEIENEWVLRLAKDSKGGLKKLISNTDLIVRNDTDTSGKISMDVFSQRIHCAEDMPFKRSSGTWSMQDTTKLCAWIGNKYQYPVTFADMDKVVHAIAADHGFHPVKNYLESVVWDGLKRLNYFLDDVFEAGRSEYHQKIGAGFFIGAVTRIYNPGAQVDSMLILDGAGGYGKSQSLAALVPDRGWYVDMTLEFGSQEFTRMLFGKWIVDMSEGTSMKKSDADRIKATITKMVDTDRPLYSSHTVDYPRQCVFVSTANDFEISNDFAMQRRMWLVECKSANPEFVRLNRDQLWAEAVVLYKKGDKYWDVSREMIEQAHENRVVHDIWEDSIAEWVMGRVTVTVKEVASSCLLFAPHQMTSGVEIRVRKCLKSIGWETFVIKESGKPKRVWHKKPVPGYGSYK